MTRRAIMTVIACDVIRICGSGEIGRMTTVAVLGSPRIHIVDMAGIARHGLMRPGQRECGQCMIEGRRFPCCRRVTWRTVMAVVACDVIRICGSGEIGRMATVAICGNTRVHIVDMTGNAGNGLMRTGQWK